VAHHRETIRGALADAGLSAKDISAIGITNQRETTVVWDRDTGAPVYNAIVWQDRRTSEFCAGKKAEGLEAIVSAKTGLLLDPYFSGTKIAWILDNVDGARARAEAGKLAFGTVDSWIIWHLTGGARHVTDATNASRTLLYNIGTGRWDDALLSILNVPASMLPDVLDSAAEFGTAKADLFGADLPILGVAGDQQAAVVGQACLQTGHAQIHLWHGLFCPCSTPVPIRCRPRTASSRPWPISWMASRPTHWKARSSLPGLPCNGCATVWGL
jgi:glycerol kinase